MATVRSTADRTAASSSGASSAAPGGSAARSSRSTTSADGPRPSARSAASGPESIIPVKATSSPSSASRAARACTTLPPNEYPSRWYGPFGCDPADRLEVARGELVDRRRGHRGPLQQRQLQPDHRPVARELAHQPGEDGREAAGGVDAEQRSGTGAVGTPQGQDVVARQVDPRCPGLDVLPDGGERRDPGDRAALEHVAHGQGHPLATGPRDEREGDDAVAADVDELVVELDRVVLQHLAQHAQQHGLRRRGRAPATASTRGREPAARRGRASRSGPAAGGRAAPAPWAPSRSAGPPRGPHGARPARSARRRPGRRSRRGAARRDGPRGPRRRPPARRGGARARPRSPRARCAPRGPSPGRRCGRGR